MHFIPIWILTTGNLWSGFAPSYEGLSQLWAVLSMLLIGYIEEIIFRGFLFMAMLPKDGFRKSIFVVAISFGIGHIINLFAGQRNLETIFQIFFAISWGFILVSIFYKSKSLLPCIIMHGLVDAFSKFSQENIVMEEVYIVCTIIVSILYCRYIFKLPK